MRVPASANLYAGPKPTADSGDYCSAPISTIRRCCTSGMDPPQGFVELLDEHIRETTPAEKYSPVPLAAQFIVGGVGQIVASWVNGTNASDPETLIDSLVQFLTAYWLQLSEVHGRAGSSTRDGADGK